MRALKYDWDSITSALPGRGGVSVRRRYFTVLKSLADVSYPNFKRFTTEENDTIRNLRAGGFYIAAIARKLGRSYNSVYSQSRRLEAAKESSPSPLGSNTIRTENPNNGKPWPRAEIDRLLDLHAAGLKPDAVARELGRTIHAVQAKYRSHLPYRLQFSQLVATGPEGDSLAASPANLRRSWTQEDDEKFIELVADGADYERIASIFDRTVPAVQIRWKQVLRPRCVYQKSISSPSDSSASSEQTQRQQVATGVPQLDSQSRRTFTTLHGTETRLAINLQKQSSALTYSSHRLVRAAPWKRCGFFSLPYRPQQRFEHTKSNPVSQIKKRRIRYSEEDTNQVIELMAREYPWHKIGEIMGRSTAGVCDHGNSSLKKERWRKTYEKVTAALPDDGFYYGARKDVQWRPKRCHAYSTEELERLVDLRARGHSLNDMAEALGRGFGSVRKTLMSLSKDARWAQRFEAARSAVPAVERLGLHRGSRRFTDEEDALITSMRKAGSPHRLIAEAIGRPTGSVTSRWRKLLIESDYEATNQQNRRAKQSFGHVNHRFTAEEDNQLRHMLSLGMKPRSMAVALGCADYSTIHSRLKVLQAPPPAKKAFVEPWSDAEKQKLRSAAANAKHASEIQQLFPNRTRHSLRQMCNILKLPNLGIFRKDDSSRWSPAQDTDLLRLRAAGETFAAIGAVVGKSMEGCKSRFYRLKEEAPIQRW